MFGTQNHPYYELVIREHHNPSSRARVEPAQPSPARRPSGVLAFIRKQLESLSCLLDRQAVRECGPARATAQ
jgi:hypothetical protein